MASILWNTEGDIYVRYFFGEIPFGNQFSLKEPGKDDMVYQRI